VTLDQLLARFKSLRESFTTVQLVSMVAAFLAAVGLVFAVTYWASRPTYRLLFSDLDAEAASQVTAKLTELKVPYELAESGHGIRVPEERVDQLRLDFAGQGLPAGGRLGFEIFDGTNFGWTEFLEQVNYRRALEGELARTIATIDEIGGARVHIAMGQKTLFARDRTPAKASVTLKLKGRAPLAASTVAGIRNLVAFAIDDLRPDAVVVMDDRGRPLAAAGDDSAVGSPAQLEARAQLEDQLVKKVATMLDPLVGSEHFRVHVTARLNHDTTDEVAEKYGREGVVRSEEHSQETAGGNPTSLGVAGARGNTPAPAAPGTNVPAAETVAAPPAVGATAGSQRVHDVRNLELDKSTTHTTRPAGGVARLSVAVLVDFAYEVKQDADGKETRSTKPRDPAFLQQVSDLTAKVVGLDTSRGDELTVQNVAFEQTFDDVLPAEPQTLLQRVSPMWIGVGAISLLAVLAGLVVVLRKRGRTRRGADTAVQVDAQVLPQQQLPRTIEEIEGEIEAQLDAKVASAFADRRVPVLTKRLQGILAKEPEAAARLVRTWLVDDAKRARA
jgi:flagellar M-ring protein FliF